MVSYPALNLVDSVIDEVALEGLDGITLKALWVRLANRFHDSLPLSETFMTQVWSICIKVKEFTFYKLESPRKSLVLFDRYEFVDPDLGIILEPDDVPEDIYPHCPIYDQAAGVKGSCSTYYTRKNIDTIVRKYTLDQVVEEYDQTLVIVASQTARDYALMGDSVCPTLELTVMQHCFLERVGRSRYQGEVTQGKLSLSLLKEDPKSLFYHRKFLLRHKLITKQMHHQKSSDHCCNGSLLHLPRFFVERKPKIIYLAEQVIEILKSKDNYVAEYEEIRKKLQIEHSIKKLFKTSFFLKVVKTDLKIPYRTLYPNAEPREWQYKNNPEKEKMIRVVQLVSPDIDIVEIWNKDEVTADEEPFELDISNHKFNVPYLKQANAIIEATQRDGICQGKLAKEMGLTKLQARTILRNLVKANIVATYMNDVGRQRVTKYVSKKFEKSSTMSKQFQQEMHKIKELTKLVTLSKEELVSTKENLQKQKNNKSIGKLQNPGEKVNCSSNVKNDTVQDSFDTARRKTSIKELNKIFYVVNKILYKYQIVKSRTRYKCTSENRLVKVSQSTTPEKVIEGNGNAQKADEEVHSSDAIFKIFNNCKAISIYKSIKTNLIAQNPTRTGKPVHEVFGFIEDVKNNEKKNIPNITYRLLRRANMIIESVKEHQVIDDMTKLTKMINGEEDKEGYDGKIDKKSLLRLLQKLTKDNLIKNIKLTLSANGREKHLNFICDPNIDINHTVIKSAVEQAKVKFSLLGSQKGRKAIKGEGKVNTQSTNNTIKTEEKLDKKQSIASKSKTSVAMFKYDPKVPKRYGYSPKFIRMQTLHLLIYYMVYGHPGAKIPSNEEQIQTLRNKGFVITDNLVKEMNRIYTTEVGWKMFIPPLPTHSGWGEGWTVMCDVLLRIPVSIFLKVHNVPFIIPDLDYYLDHPIRKHFLVKDLPAKIRNTLLYERKYIFNIHQSITRLCYIGLLQFGPQKLKEKDQVFIYINQHTELLDTTSSKPGYHKIEEKSYPVIKYTFDKMYEVEKYWYDMWNICINTSLGGRLAVQGKDIVLEDLGKKIEMIDAAIARSSEEAIKLDTGKVPGDRKGAAGIDSAFFAHLKRNWNWAENVTKISQQTRKNGVSCERDAYLSKIKVKPVRFTEFSGFKKVLGPTSVSASDLRKKATQQQNKSENTGHRKKYELVTTFRKSKQASFVRRVLPKKKRKSRVKYDEIDYTALQQMHKLRVDWDPYEDKVLLVCKVAMVYLCPNPRKQVVTFNMVRDVLRSYSYISHNKTSRACQRRLLYMFKQPQTYDSVMLGVEEVKQNFYINKRFGGIVDKIKEESYDSTEYEKRIAETFKSLVSYIAKKYYDISEMNQNELIITPTTVQEFNMFYRVIYPTNSSSHGLNDINNINDIHSATVTSVIHSSMCSGKDRRSWAYQLFKVYQQYSESLLRNVMAKIRADQMVTIKKNNGCVLKKYANCMPMSSSQYQLSTNYICKFQCKWPYSIYRECYDTLTKLLTWFSKFAKNRSTSELFNGTELQPVTGGIIAMIHDFITQNRLDFDIDIPDQIIVLDHSLNEKDETYQRIAQRYKDILESLDYFNSSVEPTEETAQNASASEVHKGKEHNTVYSVKKCPNFDTTEPNKIQMNHSETKKHGKKAEDIFDDIDTCPEQIKYTMECDDLNDENPDETASNMGDDDEESNVIKFQDGTRVTLKKEDIDGMFLDEDSVPDVQSAAKDKEICNATSDAISISVNKHKQKCINKEPSKDEHLKKRVRTTEDELYIKKPVTKKAKLNNNDVVKGQSNENVKHLEEDGHEEVKPNYHDDLGISEALNSETDINAISKTIVKDKKLSESGFTRVSEILQKAPLDQDYVNHYYKIDDTIEKRYTRIALLKIREELSELSVADSHHAHEYFVVNMFKIFYSLDSKSQSCEDFKGCTVPSDLLPLKINVVTDIINELNKFAVFPKYTVSYVDFKKTVHHEFSFNWDKVDIVYEFIEKKKEFGVTVQELMDNFYNDLEENLYHIVSLLTTHRLLLRSGVTTVRYINQHYVAPWLINSYKLYRLEKEALLPVPKGSVYVVESENAKTHSDKDNKEEHYENISGLSVCESASSSNLFPRQSDNNSSTDVKLGLEAAFPDNRGKKRGHSSESEEEDQNHPRKKIQRKKVSSSMQKEIFTKQLDFTTAEEIRVVMKPWIRVDGVLNRRVLDRMLGSILTYCLTHPGVSLARIQKRFVPALQPFHVRELVEILIKLGCVEKKWIKKQRVTLFSKPAPIKPRTEDEWVSEEETFVEPAKEAMLKFGIFLSTKIYSADFIP